MLSLPRYPKNKIVLEDNIQKTGRTKITLLGDLDKKRQMKNKKVMILK